MQTPTIYVPQILSGARLKEMREYRGLSRDDLAFEIRKRLPLSVTQKPNDASILRWERGMNAPHTTLLPAIASALGCKIEDMFVDEDA